MDGTVTQSVPTWLGSDPVSPPGCTAAQGPPAALSRDRDVPLSSVQSSWRLGTARPSGGQPPGQGQTDVSWSPLCQASIGNQEGDGVKSLLEIRREHLGLSAGLVSPGLAWLQGHYGHYSSLLTPAESQAAPPPWSPEAGGGLQSSLVPHLVVGPDDSVLVGPFTDISNHSLSLRGHVKPLSALSVAASHHIPLLILTWDTQVLVVHSGRWKQPNTQHMETVQGQTTPPCALPA